MWTTRKPSLRHLHVWSCKAEARVYNPQEKKLNPKMISCHFTGYPARSKGSRFYIQIMARNGGIDYTETFSPVSTKDSFHIIMALVAHYDLLLHQMDAKTAFLNSELEEENFMRQPEGFAKERKEHMVCKLDKAIYGLKQASRRWYFKFLQTISSYGAL
ncbi:hypothetical protein L3X38_036694 [Prunus dulcis]|uniref:Reverse transcriptase Ty1/copia-type domain-containing protein n=1 Tax=Prunus dulcis TaxID=3755 RepID=A0AAD4YNT9_PRUDU|nr:hypothetical protein L3X38_036694 [Prunus dulcis]